MPSLSDWKPGGGGVRNPSGASGGPGTTREQYQTSGVDTGKPLKNGIEEFVQNPIVSFILKAVNAPGNAVRSGIAGVAEDIRHGELNPTSAGLHALRGLIGKEHTSAPEAVGSILHGDHKPVDLPFGVATVIDTVTDPTTWVSLGASAAAERGLVAAGELFGKEAAEAIVKGGTEVLSSVERGELRRILTQQAGRAGSRKALKTADKILQAMDRSAQGGLKFAGRSIPGLTAESTVGRIASKVSPRSLGRAVASGTETGENLAGAFTRGVGMRNAPELGDDIARQVLEEQSLAATRTDARNATIEAAARNVAKGADLTDERLATVAKALDVASENEPLKALKAKDATLTRLAEQAKKKVARTEATVAKVMDTNAQRQSEMVIKHETARRALAAEKDAVLATKEAAVKDAQQKAAMAYISTAGVPGAEKVVKRYQDLARKAVEDYKKTAERYVIKTQDLAAKHADERAVKTAEMAAKASEAQSAHELTQRMTQRFIDSKASAAKAVQEQGNTVTAIEGLRAAGDPELANVIDFANNVRQTLTKEQIAAGIGKEHWEQFTPEYLSRYLTKAGKRAIKRKTNEVSEALGRVGMTKSDLELLLDEGGRTRARELRPDLSIKQINELMVERGVVKPGQKFFEDNPLVATVRRAQQATAAVEHVKMLDRLTQIKDANGKPILRVVEKGAKHHKEEVLDLTDEIGKRYVGHPEVIKVLNDAQAVVRNDASIKEIHNLYQRWAREWRGLAVLSPGFHARNEVGNVWLNWLAGLKNPKYYVEAARLQKAVMKVYGSLGPDANFAAALEQAALSNADKAVLRDALDTGVLGHGFFDIDVPGKAITGQRHIKDFSLNRANRAVGSAIENNARLAHYLYKIETLGDKQAAARSVKKFLFDYGDLTPFERHVMKAIVPFYTFMRKNTPLEIEQALLNPRKFSMYLHAQQDAQDHGVNIMPDVPINNADDILRIILGGNSPDSPVPTDNPLAQRARALVAPMEPLLKTVMESAASRSLYTGFPMRNGWSTAENAARNIIPPYSKVRSGMGQYGRGGLWEVLRKTMLGLKDTTPASARKKKTEDKSTSPSSAGSLSDWRP